MGVLQDLIGRDEPNTTRKDNGDRISLPGDSERKSALSLEDIRSENRDGEPKAYTPEYLYRAPYGVPREKNLSELRELASTTFVEMVINLLIDEISAIDGSCQIKEEVDVDEATRERLKETRDRINAFFQNPNSKKERFTNIRKVYLRDLFEIDSGVVEKVFDKKGSLQEIYARDGATFTKNPDQHGTFKHAEDLIGGDEVISVSGTRQRQASAQVSGYTSGQHIDSGAAYYQYGFNTRNYIIPFGRREVMFMERYPRPDEYYGRSPIEALHDTIKLLYFSVLHELDYFQNENPGGIATIKGEDLDTESWKDQLKHTVQEKSRFGRRRKGYEIPITNKDADWTRFRLTAEEMDMVAQQRWFAKLVWSSFGVTPSELGFTQDSNKATEIVQSKTMRKRTILPVLNLEKHHIDTELISEFDIPGLEDEETEDYLEWGWDTFDVDEQMKKYKLYSLQSKNGFKTINEIREEENMEPLEDVGDESVLTMSGGQGREGPQAPSIQQVLNPGSDDGESREGKSTESKDVEDVEGKPFAGYSDFDECVAENSDKQDPEGYCAVIQREVEGKTEYDGKLKAEDYKPGEDNLEVKAEVAEDLYTTEEEARERADELDLEGVHSHTVEDSTFFMPGGSHEEYKEAVEVESKDGDPCWEGYEMVGTKIEDGREVPNCVPEEKAGQKREELEAKNEEFKAVLSEEERTPPQTAQENAQQVLEWRDEHSDEIRGMTETGWRRADQLASGDALSIDVIQKMSQFQRHRDNSSVDEEHEGEPWKDAGRVAWLGWGGDTGVEWAERTVEKYEEEKQEQEEDGGGEGKALATDSPLAPKENEKPEDHIQRVIELVLEDAQEQILDDLERQVESKNVRDGWYEIEGKDIEQVTDNVEEYFDVDAFETYVAESIENVFKEQGSEVSEEVDENFTPNPSAADFLSNHTFDRVKDMTEEIANDLQAELERGFINGEGISDLKNRVRDVFDVEDSRAQAIARTEVNRAENTARRQALEQSKYGDVAKKYINIVRDERTSNISKALDRKYGSKDDAIPVGEEFEVSVDGETVKGMQPPFHVNDRDKMEVFVPEDEL